MSKTIEQMTGTELVAEFNRLSPESPVKRFASREDGIRRIRALASGTSTSPSSDPGEKKKLPSSATGAAGMTGESTMSTKLVTEFGVRPDSNRAKVLSAMTVGKMTKRAALLKAVYGSPNEKNVGALSMVFKGIDQTIKSEKLPYEIKRAKDENKEVSYGIFRK